MEIVGYGFIIGCIIGSSVIFLGYEHIKVMKPMTMGIGLVAQLAGWHASIDHQEKLQ
jgi:hypothetical protein